MKKTKSFLKQHRKLMTATSVTVIIAITAIIIVWITSAIKRKDIPHSTVIVEYRHYETLLLNGKPVLYIGQINKDSTFSYIALHSDSIQQTKQYVAGCWIRRYPAIPSCRGRIATFIPDRSISGNRTESYIRRVIAKNINMLIARRDSLNDVLSELKYYMKTHQVNDDGYDMIAKQHSATENRLNTCDSIISLIQNISPSAKVNIQPKEVFNIIYFGLRNKKTVLQAYLRGASDDKRLCLLQVKTRRTPIDVIPQNLWSWEYSMPEKGFSVLTGNPALPSFGAAIAASKPIPVRFHKDKRRLQVPPMLITNGSPICNNKGFLMGLVAGDSIISRTELRKLFSKAYNHEE